MVIFLGLICRGGKESKNFFYGRFQLYEFYILPIAAVVRYTDFLFAKVF